MSNKTKKTKEPIRVLVWGDSPAVATGFAMVTRHIFKRLGSTDDYSIDFIGINDLGGWKDPEKYGKNVRIFPAMPLGQHDVFGRGRLVNTVMLQDPEIKGPWDLVFTINDPFVLEQTITEWGGGTLDTIYDIKTGFLEKLPPKYWFKIISYWPVDSSIKQIWFEKAISKCDYPVAYSDYAKGEIEAISKTTAKVQLGGDLETIYHGVDTTIFKPLPEDEIKEFKASFSQNVLKEDTFVVSIIARNQPRKDIPRAMKAFKEFQKRRPDSFLYIHARNDDAGGTLTEYANTLGLKLGEDWGMPKNFSENRGIPEEALNYIYNMSDCIMSTTLGEGFGLPFFEAMAAGVVNIAPDNTTVPELFNVEKGTDVQRLNDDDYISKIRGIGVKSGSNLTEHINLGRDDKERYRPITNVEDMVQKLLWIYDNPSKVKEIEDRALAWVKQYDWDNITSHWDKLFKKAYNDLETERANWKPKEGQKEGPQNFSFDIGKKKDE